MGEDVNTVSPTLGFIIKTIDYQGYAHLPPLLSDAVILMCPIDISSTYVCPVHAAADEAGQQLTRR